MLVLNYFLKDLIGRRVSWHIVLGNILELISLARAALTLHRFAEIVGDTKGCLYCS